MNFFTLFEIPVQLKIDPSTLSRRYFELSRKYHPDFFTGAGAEKQAEMLEKSAQLNKALKTFQNPDSTLKYVLMLKGLLTEEEKYQLPPDFLMEVMEINEGLMDFEMEGNASGISAVKEKIEAFEKAIYAPVQATIENYQEGVTSEAELLAVKEYYYKKKYLERIREQLSGMQ